MADATITVTEGKAVVVLSGDIGGELLTQAIATQNATQAAIDAAIAAGGDAAVAGALAGQEAGAAAGAEAALNNVGTTAGTLAAGDDSRIVGAAQKALNLSDLSDAAAARANLGLRYVGGRTFYVRKDGSDSNDGLSNTSGGAFLTIQRAVNAAYSIDARGSVVQIRIADGTYAEGVNIYGRPVGAFDNGDQPLRIIGNETNPENVVINPTGQDAVRIGDKATVLLAGLAIGTTTSGTGLLVSNGAQVHHRNLRFLACATETIGAFGHCSVIAIGNTTVVGASGGFVHATNKAIVGFSGRTLTFVGTPTFTTYLWGINDASIYLDSATIVGKANGGITVHIGGILNVSSCTGVWTGGQPLLVTSGGLIIAEDKIALKTFYVRSDGNNNNSGFDNTADGAFFSIQAAVNRLSQMPYDLVGYENDSSGSYDWRIVVGAGTFSEAISLLDTRFARVTISGASSSTTIGRSYLSRAIRTAWTITNQRLGGSGVNALHALEGSQITFNNVDFTASSYFGIADAGGRLIASGPFSISGSATGAFLARTGGYITMADRTVTITGTPALGTFLNIQTTAIANAVSAVFSGSATGKRYDVQSNGVIDVNGAGATFLPGNVAGTTATGGQYV